MLVTPLTPTVNFYQLSDTNQKRVLYTWSIPERTTFKSYIPQQTSYHQVSLHQCYQRIIRQTYSAQEIDAILPYMSSTLKTLPKNIFFLTYDFDLFRIRQCFIHSFWHLRQQEEKLFLMKQNQDAEDWLVQRVRSSCTDGKNIAIGRCSLVTVILYKGYLWVRLQNGNNAQHDHQRRQY